MKKHYPILTVLILSICIVSCKKENIQKKNSSLVGKWYYEWKMEANISVQITEDYTFGSNGTYIHSDRVYSKGSQQFLGYRAITKGTYRVVNDNTVIIDANESFYPENANGVNYALESALINQNKNPAALTVYYELKPGDKLLLHFPCPPNAFCVGAITYHKDYANKNFF